MAEMSKRQTKFSSAHHRELKEIDKEEKKHQQQKSPSDHDATPESKTVAVGVGKTTPRWRDKM